MSVESAEKAVAELDAAILACHVACASSTTLEERLAIMRAQQALRLLCKGRRVAYWAEVNKAEARDADCQQSDAYGVES